jgi:hypothetical protein
MVLALQIWTLDATLYRNRVEPENSSFVSTRQNRLYPLVYHGQQKRVVCLEDSGGVRTRVMCAKR